MNDPPVACPGGPAELYDQSLLPKPDEGRPRPARSRHRPLHFREDTTGTINPPASQDIEENFDLTNISDNEEPPVPRARGSQYADDLGSTVNTDPLMVTQSSQKQPSSADVKFFFPKCKGESMSCTMCK